MLGGLEDRQDPLVERRPGIDDDHVVALEQRRQDLLDVGRGDRLGGLRRGRCGEHVEAAVVAHRVGPQQLGLAQRRLVADHVGEGLLRVQVEERRDATELEREVDQDDLVGPLARPPRWRCWSRSVVVPTPPLGLYTATVRRAAVRVSPSAETTGARSFERWKRRSRASTRASSSRASNGRAMTSSAPASRKRDPLLDVVGRADAHDRDGAHRRRGPDLAADLDGGRRPARRCR